MKANYLTLNKRIVKKAQKSICKFKVVAIGIDRRNKIIGIEYNRPRFSKKGGGIHAEMAIMRKMPPSLCKIMIARINNGGAFNPIEPCSVCAAKASELGVRILGVS